MIKAQADTHTRRKVELPEVHYLAPQHRRRGKEPRLQLFVVDVSTENIYPDSSGQTRQSKPFPQRGKPRIALWPTQSTQLAGSRSLMNGTSPGIINYNFNTDRWCQSRKLIHLNNVSRRCRQRPGLMDRCIRCDWPPIRHTAGGGWWREGGGGHQVGADQWT